MADATAAAIDKVGAPGPAVPEAEAGAATVNGSAGLDGAPGHSAEAAKSKIADGAGPAVGAPTSVEVKSVPDTPVNGAAPAAVTPKLESETKDESTAAAKDPAAATGATDTEAAPANPAPGSDVAPGAAVTNGNTAAETTTPATHTGPETETVPATAPPPSAVADTAAAPVLPSEPIESPGTAVPAAAVEAATGDKRPLDEGAPPTARMESPPPPAKKAKLDDSSAETNGGNDVNGSSPTRKPGRPKKEKAAAPQVGRTARKTRSQGPAEA